MRTLITLSVLLFSGLLIQFSVLKAHATSRPEDVPNEAAVDQRLNQKINLDLIFKDEKGNSVTLRQLIIPGRPAVIAPVYYGCPNLCTFTLNALVDAVNEMKLGLGEDFTVIAYSINPRETPELASKKSAKYYQELKVPTSGEKGWHFLTGDESSINQLSQDIGFHFKKDGDDYIHASVILAVTPQGLISRYFMGMSYAPVELQRGLVEASAGKIGAISDKLFLFCFRYDHLSGKYTLLIWNITRAFCLTFAAAIIGFLAFLRMREVHSLKKGSVNV